MFDSRREEILDFGFWILDWKGRAAEGTCLLNPKSKIGNPKSTLSLSGLARWPPGA
jgi:hypothetical protein